MKRHTGKIQRWDDDRGFGFATDDASGDKLFVHIKALRTHNRRLIKGTSINYRVGQDDSGRPRAEDVHIAGSGGLGLARMKILLTLVASSAVVGALAWHYSDSDWLFLLACWYGVASALSFITYALDKSAARRDAWRTPEKTLHLLDLMGGWPGGLAAQRLLRHKSSKSSFQTVFWVTVVLNCATGYWILSPEGEHFLHDLMLRR